MNVRREERKRKRKKGGSGIVFRGDDGGVLVVEKKNREPREERKEGVGLLVVAAGRWPVMKKETEGERVTEGVGKFGELGIEEGI